MPPEILKTSSSTLSATTSTFDAEQTDDEKTVVCIGNKLECFIYQYHTVDDADEGCRFIGFGLDEQNETIALIINGFRPHCYVELPEQKIAKNRVALTNVIEILTDKLDRSLLSLAQNGKISPDSIPNWRPMEKKLVNRKKLYFAHKTYNETTDKYDDTLFYYLRFSFHSQKALSQFAHALKFPINYKNGKKHHFKIHEANYSVIPLFKFLASRNLPSCGWISCERVITQTSANRLTTCPQEYKVNYQRISPADHIEKVVLPTVLTFDIETYSSISGQHPKSERPDDVVFNIGVIVSKPNSTQKILLCLGEEFELEGVQVKSYGESEVRLLLGLWELIQEVKPHVITGYNILSYDFKYIVDRCKFLHCLSQFAELGYMIDVKAPLIDTEATRAKMEARNQSEPTAKKKAKFLIEMCYFDIPGILQIDLLPVIKDSYSMPNYKLDTVSKEFGFDGKSGLHYMEMYKLYKSGGVDNMRIIGEYCIQDCMITYQIFQKSLSWFSLCEMAKTANVPLMYIFTKGNQIQMYAQVIRHCYANDFILESASIESQDGFEGAIVLEPVPGLYDNVLSFDFASLYPSIIMSHNIDFTTLVVDDSIPDKYCHVKEWSSTVKNKATKEIATHSYRFKFVKEQYSTKGVIPTIIQAHIQARKATRMKLKDIDERILDLEKTDSLSEEHKAELEDLKLNSSVLDKRQLAFKICANCFPAEDHEILTKLGFMKLDQVLNHFQKFQSLQIACYVDGELQYHKITSDKVIQQNGTFDMIKFEKTWSNVSICATGNHRMWARLGSTRENQFVRNPQYKLHTASEIYAQGQSDHRTVAQFKCNFEKGFKADISESERIIQKVMTSLNLKTDDEFNAFLELYGYWLGDGCLLPTSKSLGFYPMKCADSAYLLELFRRLKFKIYIRNKTTKENFKLKEQGAYVDQDPPKKTKSSRKYESWTTKHVLRVHVDEWWTFFCLEYGNKYVGVSTFSTILEHAKLHNIPVPVTAVSNSDITQHEKRIPQDYRLHQTKAFKESHNKVEKGVVISSLACDQTYAIAHYNDAETTKSAKWFGKWCFDSLDKSQLRCIFKGLRMADGDQANADNNATNSFSIYTSSMRFANEIEHLSIHAGFSCSFITSVEAGQSRGFNQNGQEYIATATAMTVKCTEYSPLAQPKLTISQNCTSYKYTGTVWCVTVPTSPSLICVRRSYKINDKLTLSRSCLCQNSLYGAMGVSKGYLPFKPGAMTTTMIGRESIEKVADIIRNQFNGTVVYGDSVTASTPVVLRCIDTAQVHIIPIKKLWDLSHTWSTYCSTKNFQSSGKQHSYVKFDVWCNGKWSKITRVIRHQVNKLIYKVTTRLGSVEVTEDHSLVSSKMSLIEPTKSLGLQLLHSFPADRECANRHSTDSSNSTITVLSSSSITLQDAYLYGYVFGWKCLQSLRPSQSCNCILRNHLPKSYDQVPKFIVDLCAMITAKSLKAELVQLFASGSDDNDLQITHHLLNDTSTVRTSFAYGYERAFVNSPIFLRIDNTYQIASSVLARESNFDVYGFSAPCTNAAVTQALIWIFKHSGLNVRYTMRNCECMMSHCSDKLMHIEFHLVRFIENEVQRNNERDVYKVEKIQKQTNQYVYDLETEEGVFQAGIGSIVVKNTDSCHVCFSEVTSNEEAEIIADLVTGYINPQLLRPMKLEYEKLYYKYFILTKKRYIAYYRDKNNKQCRIEKGVISKRRDNCQFLRSLFTSTVERIMSDVASQQILDHVLNSLNAMFHLNIDYHDFIVTKLLNDSYANRQAHWVLSQTMKERGTTILAGTRMEFVYIDKQTGRKLEKPEDKIEDLEYYERWRRLIKLDMVYYLKSFCSPLDEILKVGLKMDEVVLDLYRAHVAKRQTVRRLQSIASNIELIE